MALPTPDVGINTVPRCPPTKWRIQIQGALKLTYTLEHPVALLVSTQLAGWKDEK